MLKLIRKHIYVFQPPITLNLADLGIVTSYKLKHNDKGSECFVDYKYDNIIRLLCIILPQMSGYIKHFGNYGKIYLSFLIEDSSVKTHKN